MWISDKQRIQSDRYWDQLSVISHSEQKWRTDGTNINSLLTTGLFPNKNVFHEKYSMLISCQILPPVRNSLTLHRPGLNVGTVSVFSLTVCWGEPRWCHPSYIIRLSKYHPHIPHDSLCFSLIAKHSRYIFIYLFKQLFQQWSRRKSNCWKLWCQI